jgi:hypothetical protein
MSTRQKYCVGCEQAEVQETKAELMYEENVSYAEVMAHVNKYWEPTLCTYCQEDAEEMEF